MIDTLACFEALFGVNPSKWAVYSIEYTRLRIRANKQKCENARFAAELITPIYKCRANALDPTKKQDVQTHLHK